MLKFLLLMMLQFCVKIPSVGNVALNKNLDNALYSAAKDGDEKKVKSLLKKVVDIYYRNVSQYMKDYTPMTAAAKGGCVGVMKLLIKAGVDPNKEDYQGRTPLGEVFEWGQRKAIDFLVKEEKVDINKASEGNSLFERAMNGAEEDTIMYNTRLLVQAGIDINSEVGGFTPLLSLILHTYRLYDDVKKAEALEFLLENGADPNVVNIDGCSPLFAAANSNKSNLVKILLDAGADPNGGDSIIYTPLYAQYVEHPTLKGSDQDIKKMLLDRGATFTKADYDGVSIICKIAQMTHTPKICYDLVDAVEALVDNGFAFDDEDSEGKTPLYYAGEAMNLDVVEYLLEKGASLRKAIDAGLDVIKIRKGGKALIHILAEKGWSAKCCNGGLIAAQINVLTRYGRNILHCALSGMGLWQTSADNVQAMVNAGCLLSQEDRSGKLPIEMILKGSNKFAPEYEKAVKCLYYAMKKNRDCASLMPRVKESIEKDGTDEVKEFLVDEKKKTIKNDKKRKANDDNDLGKKKAKVVQAVRKGKGKKK